jgi:hypothetical protein
MYGERRTFELDKVYRGAEGRLPDDEDSRSFQTDNIHKS